MSNVQLVETRMEHAIREAMRRGQTGFRGPAPSLFGTQVLTVIMADPDESVPWIITLTSQVMTTPVAFGAAGLPPDNTVQTAFNAATATPAGQPPEAFASVFNLLGGYVRVTWGLGNAMERAYVDYPFGGCTIQVTGSFVRVELPPNRVIVASAATPSYGGFVAPAIAGRQLGRPNTLTSGTVNLVALNGTHSFAVPPRARGYRLYTDALPPASLSQGLTVIQQSFQSSLATVTFDDDSAFVFQGDLVSAAGSPGVQMHAQDTSYQDLDPRTEFVQLNNLNPTQALSVGVVWQLDLS